MIVIVGSSIGLNLAAVSTTLVWMLHSLFLSHTGGTLPARTRARRCAKNAYLLVNDQGVLAGHQAML
jgi:hypothetical protein